MPHIGAPLGDGSDSDVDDLPDNIEFEERDVEIDEDALEREFEFLTTKPELDDSSE